MRKQLNLIIIAGVALLTLACTHTSKQKHTARVPQPSDTLYTRQAATNALRTEAEIGAALYAMGRQEEGMAKLDSAIFLLDATFERQENHGTFQELDALVECGFSSNAYFSNCFRQHYSMSPSDFRRDALKLFTKKKV